jgi:signal transduction histidine kinase
MRALVERLPERIGDPPRLARDAAQLGELVQGLAGSIERFVREATEGAKANAESRRLDELVAESAHRVERLHGAGRVAQNVDPALRGLRVNESLGRAVGNLLDNALHASPPGAEVQLVATRSRAGLELVIADAGCGMSEQQLARVFEPGFTTRAERGGSGVGLPVALSIVELLGGRLELCSSARGTRATIRLPVAR